MTGPGERLTLASVVEGEGEMRALPVLLRRLLYAREIWDADIRPPFRMGRGSLLANGGVERAVEAQARRLSGAHTESGGGVLILIDADDDCPASLGPALLRRAERARPDVRTAVVLANREFEAWFLAAAPSLGGAAGMPDGLTAPEDSERPRDCKGWLTLHRTDGSPYKPVADQAPLAQVFDLELARAHSPSFRKFCRDIEFLITGKTGTRGK
ncbi:DUF4276 family protein [Streptomyces sp. NPDC048172]|uniref:DUF4276 family protein n=1 Tax=Streptomyces sp. NPDC048172 TaxID=3365505 RepID=UPI00371A9272